MAHSWRISSYTDSQYNVAGGSSWKSSASPIAVQTLGQPSPGFSTGMNQQIGSSSTAYDPSHGLHGAYLDEYWFCSTKCPSETDALQTITYDGQGLPHTNALVYRCSGITVDGNEVAR